MNSENLNQSQKEAVLHTDGPILILAGAGTGKTKVLTSRIIHIINSYQANSKQILAVTFTNKAAMEMKRRIALSIGDEVNNIWAGTFHSIASRILKRHPEVVGLKADFTIIDNDDQLRLIKQIAADLNIDIKEFPPKNYLYAIERFKDKALSVQDLKRSDFEKLPKLFSLYENYQMRLKALNAVDFGDLLLYNLELFKHEEILAIYQNKFHHILVDEYQDTNHAQYQWLLKLAAKYQNICAVGDDDQSIYSWRGAEVANILKFEKDFPGTKIVRLEQNYRSTQNILKVASHVIKNNAKRHGKTLWSDGDMGNKIKLFSFIDDRSEASNIGFTIKDLQKNYSTNLNDIAILVRASYQTRAFEESFMQNSLPYKIIGGLRFYERKEIKDSIAYLRIIFNFNDDLALERIINLPKRGVGNVAITNLFEKARDEKLSLFLAIKNSFDSGIIKGKAKESLKKLIENIESWRTQSTSISVSDLAKKVLFESEYLQMWQNEKTPDAEGRVENIKEFISSLEKFENLGEFLEYVSLVSTSSDEDQKTDMVNIMTVHGAKGLEFDTIFIPGLEEGVFPSARAVEERNGIEEERRLFYVAITRAKQKLFLSMAQNRMIYGNVQMTIASQFLKELPEDVVEVEMMDDYSSLRSAGYGGQARNNFYNSSKSKNNFYSDNFHSDVDSSSISSEQNSNKNNFLYKRIFHQKFGYGKVIEAENDRLKIMFDKAGTKTVMSSFVQMA